VSRKNRFDTFQFKKSHRSRVKPTFFLKKSDPFVRKQINMSEALLQQVVQQLQAVTQRLETLEASRVRVLERDRVADDNMMRFVWNRSGWP
jgi:hypothetical protein